MGKQVQLVRDARRALAMRKQTAADAPMLSVDVTTPSAFLEEVWDLFGDSKCIITSTQRQLLMMRALRECAHVDGFPLATSLGVAQLLATFASRYAGVPALEDALGSCDANREGEGADSLSACSSGQRAALCVVARYRELCDEALLVEPGAAAHALCEAGVPRHLAVDEPVYVAPAVEAWLESAGAHQVSSLHVEALPAGVEARFTFTTGSTAIMRAVKEEIERAAELARGCDPRIIVFAPDPAELYRSLAAPLALEGMRAACRHALSFSRTQLGCALEVLRQMGREGGDQRLLAVSFAHAAWSGMTDAQVERFDAWLRRDSLLSPTDAVHRFEEESPTFAACRRVVEEMSVASVDALRAIVDAEDILPPRMRMQEMAALEALRDVVESAASLKCDAAAEVLSAHAVAQSFEVVPSEQAGATVEFLPMSAMDGLAEASVDAVIFADMTKDAFPLPSAKPATDAIVEALGMQDERSRHDELRAAFVTAERAVRRTFSCIVPLRSFAGGQKYPSFIYDELVAALSGGDVFEMDPDGLFKVPECARGATRMLDEMDVVRGFGQSFGEPAGIMEVTWAGRGHLSELEMRDFMRMSDVRTGLPVLSASQMEQYVQCPYRWFASRKVGVECMDEQFDAMHTGTFAHEVLRRTFDALAEEGIERVSAENVDAVRSAGMAAFDALLAEQPERAPLDRCVAIDEHDRACMDQMRKQIQGVLELMQHLPDGFAVKAREYPLDPEEGIEYAGAVINGSVDRIDVSEDGRYVVLDYKGSAGKHDAGVGSKGLTELPAKVQALIYAQCVGRISNLAGMACVGALYLGYRAKEKKQLLAGSYDAVRYEAKELINGSRSLVSMDFQAYLDQVEAEIAKLVERMCAGDIFPDPKAGACSFCEMTFCDMRMTG